MIGHFVLTCRTFFIRVAMVISALIPANFADRWMKVMNAIDYFTINTCGSEQRSLATNGETRPGGGHSLCLT